MPAAVSLMRQRLGGLVAGVVAIERDQHALDAVRLEGREQFVGEAVHAVGGGDVAITGAPEGHAHRSGLRTG